MIGLSFRSAVLHAAGAAVAGAALAGCAHPVSIAGDRLDPEAVRIASTVAVPHGSVKDFSPASADAGSRLAAAWYVEPAHAVWVTGPVRITRLTWYGDTGTCLGCPRTFAVSYDATTTWDAGSPGRRARLVATHGVASVTGPTSTTPDGAGHPIPIRLDAAPVFDADGRLVVAPARFAGILHAGLEREADVPPVAGVAEFGDPFTSSACATRAAILRERAALRRTLFVEPFGSTPPPAIAARAARAAAALSSAFAACARSRVDPHAAAWASLWANDAALFAGGQTPRRNDSAGLAAWRRDVRFGDMRRARVRASMHAPYADVAAFAAWVASRRTVHYGDRAAFLASTGSDS